MSKTRKWHTALVTGASEGIGEAFARVLARDGCDLVIIARRRRRLERLADELAGRHRIAVEPLAADLIDPGGLAAVEARIESTERPVDLLINNAGGASQHRPFLELDRERLAADAYLNALALLRLTHAAARAMSARGGGHVINVSAGVAFYPLPGAAAYGASKAFVNSLSEALAYELRDEGVGVTAVCPGFTRTGAQRRLGLNVDRVPGPLWMEPEGVAAGALRAAGRGKRVSSLDTVGALNAFAGRNLPRRILLPRVARAQLRLAKP
jgi:short-subunit dehydrogenase